MQSKKMSHLEVLTNQIFGIVIGWLIVYYIFPELKNLTQSQLATSSAIIFFIASYIRTYLIRRFFNILYDPKPLNEKSIRRRKFS